MLNDMEKDMLRNLKCLFDFKEDIFNYYQLMDTTHIISKNKVQKSLESNGTMSKKGEQSINIISAILIDLLINNKIRICVNDIGNIPSKSDMSISNGELLEMKRIPIGTNEYDKGNKQKYINVKPENMTIMDVVCYVKDKVNEYTVKNIGNKQKSDYIGFYFAISNNDLYSNSIESIHEQLYKELNSCLNVFKDVFFIYNKISLVDKIKRQHIGETICLSLKDGSNTILSFNTPETKEQRILGDINEETSEQNILSEIRENSIQIVLNNEENKYNMWNSIFKGVWYYEGPKFYGYGNLPVITLAIASSNRHKKYCSITTIGDEPFKPGNEESNFLYFIGEIK